MIFFGGGESVGEIERLLLSMGTWSLPSLPFQLPALKVLDTRQVRLSPSPKTLGLRGEGEGTPQRPVGRVQR